METPTEKSKRIAKNTLVLYVRMVVMTLLGLFTTRITLGALGIDNLGIYNVVGGVVGMFSLISGSMSASISRFMTFGLGKGDNTQLTKIFSASINIQLAISLVIIILAEACGIWFINHRLVIPPDRLFAANIVFQLSLFSFVLNLISVPYNAAIIAHEKMSAFAFMTIFQVVFKLLLISLLLFTGGDKLILFAVFICVQGLISQFIYWIYCSRKFAECHYKFVKEKALYKDMFGFAGWNTIGASSAIFSDQGINILLNMFFGPAINGAKSIVSQMSSVLGQFSGNFMTAVNPQITKDYAAGELTRMHHLMFKSTKLSYFMFLTMCLPFFLETRTALTIWLGECPEYTISFARLTFILALSQMLSNTLITAQLATGNIRNYQIVVGGAQMLNFPLSWIVLKAGAPAYSILIVAIAISQLCLFLRIGFLRTMIQLPARAFLKDVYLKVVLVSILSLPIPTALYLIMPESIMRFIIVSAVSVIVTISVSYKLGCDSAEKSFVKETLKKFITRLKPSRPLAA